MQIGSSQILRKAAKYLLIGLAILYLLDWSVFKVRGTPMGSVTVEQYVKMPLKGNKVEYDYTGTMETSCSRTVFPQYSASQWNLPCWWVEQHKTHWQ
jgi:hypothetical protein